MTGILNRDTVIFQLTALAVRLGRKLDSKVFDAYHSFLAHRMSEEQFIHACTTITEEDDRFPSIHRILEAGREHRGRELGEPYLVGGGPLSECLADLDAGRSFGGDDQFRGRPGVKPHIERLVYEDVAVTTGEIPGELLTSRLKRIVESAEAQILRLQAAHEAASSPLQATK